jgi:hypothetical protein
MRKAMLSTIAMLVVAVISLTGVTYAWFTAGDYATVSGMTMNVATAAGGVEVSADNTTWANNVTLTTNTDLVKPVSTANAKNFFDVEFNPNNSAEIKAVAGSTDNVIVQKLYLRNTGTEDTSVNLNYTTIASAANSKNQNKETNIVNAARMAVLDKDGTIISGIYAPSTEQKYYAINNTTSDYFAAYGAHTSATTEITTKGLSDIVINLPKMPTSTTYSVVEITVVIWVEGQDTDAINQNAGGAFDIALNFQKVGTTQNVAGGN